MPSAKKLAGRVSKNILPAPESATYKPNSMTTTETPVLKDFSPAGREFLSAFYKGHEVPRNDAAEKIKALRKEFVRTPMMVASSEGIFDDAAELRALEFYVLDKYGF